MTEISDTPGKSGRKAKPPNPDDGPLATFAHELWALKRRAGDPSFAAMRTRLGAVASKSSLAAATRGTALPSWETTWEFVRVLAVDQLGADAEETRREWLARWTAARADTDPAGDAADTGDAAPVDQAPVDQAPVDRATVAPARAAGERVRLKPVLRLTRRRIVVACVTVFLVGAIAAGLGFLGAAFSGPGSGQTPTAPFDEVIFEGDVTFPDGSVVAPGQMFTKAWQLRNIGSMRWEGRYLTRVNSTPCYTPEMVPIPDTDPGSSVRIEVPVTASESPAHCKIFWKMTDAERRLLFPDKNPIFLDVVVREQS
ncbi:MAG: NBR1-Ig-like domain-containing protein [Pseudonocardiaceae bacterium]